MTRQISLTTCCVLIFVTGAFAQEKKDKLSDPIEILKRADSAAKAVKVAQYEAKAFALDGDNKETPVGEGKAVIYGFVGRGPKKFNVTGTFQRPGSEDKQRLTIGSDGDEYFLIDHQTKKAYVDIDPAVTGPRGQLVGGIMMVEYVHATPFSDELNGTKQKLVGSTKVGDEECYEVDVTYASVNQQARWFFSTKDYLPRRVDRLFLRDGQPTRGSRLVVTSLKVDPKNAEAMFRFKLPDGFEKVDDFAP